MSKTSLRWGILGTANIAKEAMIPGIKGSETGILYAIASRSFAKAKEAAEEFSAEKAYGSYEELLQDRSVDAVYIPLPNHLHKPWVLQAAKAGKHVLCEKPIALNTEETQEMIETCNNENIILSEAFMYRYQPRFSAIKKRIANGEIGEVRGICGSFTFNNAKDVNNIRADRSMGGGGLYDVGVYPISAARMILEEEPEAATMHAFFSPEHDNVDMVAAGLLEFSNGKFLTFDCGMWAASRNELEILGTEGRIEIPTAFTARTKGYSIYHGDNKEYVDDKDYDQYALQADAMTKAISGTPLPFTSEDALHNMKVIDACLTSANTRTRVTLG